MSQSRISNAAIRLYLMDRPEYNTLLDGILFTEEMINSAVIFTVAYFNESNPPAIPSFFSVETFPYSYSLLTGTCGFLLKSASVNQAMNQLEYNADNVTIDDKNKSEIFFKLGSQMWNEYKEMCTNIKSNINVASCYGGISSEWATRAFTN